MEEVALGIRFALAELFLLAGLSKLPRLPEFEQAVRRYELLPEAASRRVARAVPVVELVTGTLLAVGFGITVAAVALAAALAAFTVAISINLIRGRDIDCGCFSATAPRRITWRTVGRNIIFAAGALYVAVAHPAGLSLDAAFGWAEVTTSADAAVAVLISATVGVAAAGLLLNAARLHRLVVRANGASV